jgi:hypothetical protein
MRLRSTVLHEYHDEVVTIRDGVIMRGLKVDLS